MGNFKIEINCVGGHGVDRKTKDGEVVNFYLEGNSTPDAIAKTFTEMLRAFHIQVDSATLTHWPGDPSEVKDNLLTGKRTGNF